MAIIHIEYVTEDPDSSETVELSGELPSRTSHSLKERFMSITLFSKLSSIKLRSTKVRFVIYCTIVCWLFAIAVSPLHSFNHRRIQELRLVGQVDVGAVPLPRKFFTFPRWNGTFWGYSGCRFFTL